MMKNKASAIMLAFCAGFSALRCSHDTLSPSQFSAFSNVSDAALPDSMQQAYYEDAARLALRELGRKTDLAAAPVELPSELVQHFYQALILVYNAVDLPARDAVVKDYEIHTRAAPELYRVVLSVDTTIAWVKALRRGEALTGEPRVDELLQRYALKLERNSFAFDFFVLQTQQPLNIAALAKQFSEIAGVYEAQRSILIGGDSDIYASIKARNVELRYTFAWGDCPSGCIYGHDWQFLVHEDGRVEFVRDWGSPLPK